MSLFIVTHAFGFDSLRSKWNAPILFILLEQYFRNGHVEVHKEESLVMFYAIKLLKIHTFTIILNYGSAYSPSCTARGAASSPNGPAPCSSSSDAEPSRRPRSEPG